MAQLAVIAAGTGPPARPVMVRPPKDKNKVDEAVKAKPSLDLKVSPIHKVLDRSSFESDLEYQAYRRVRGLSLPSFRTKEVAEVATAASPTSSSSSEAQRYERWLRNEAPVGYTKGVQTRGEVVTVYDDSDGKQRQLILNRRCDAWVDTSRKEFYTVPKLKSKGVHRVEVPNHQYLMVTWIGGTWEEDRTNWQRARKLAIRRTSSSQARRKTRRQHVATATLNAIRAGATIPLPKVKSIDWHEQSGVPDTVKNIWEYNRTKRLLRGSDPIPPPNYDVPEDDLPWPDTSVPGEIRAPEHEPLEPKLVPTGKRVWIEEGKKYDIDVDLPKLDRSVIFVNSDGLASPVLPPAANDHDVLMEEVYGEDYPVSIRETCPACGEKWLIRTELESGETDYSCMSCSSGTVVIAKPGESRAEYNRLFFPAAVPLKENHPKRRHHMVSADCPNCNHKVAVWNSVLDNFRCTRCVHVFSDKPLMLPAPSTEIHRGNVDDYDPNAECPVCDGHMAISHGYNRCSECGFSDDTVLDVTFDVSIDPTDRPTALRQLNAARRKIVENLNAVDQLIQVIEDKELGDQVAKGRGKIRTRAQYRAVMRDAELADKELRARFARKYPRMRHEHERDVQATANVFGRAKRSYIFRRNQRRMNDAKRLGIWKTVAMTGKGKVGIQFSMHLQRALRLHSRWLLTNGTAEMHPSMRSRLSPFERWVHGVGDTTHTPAIKKRALLGICDVELPAPQPVYKDGEVIGFVKTAHSYVYDMDGVVKPTVPTPKPVPKRTFLNRVGEFIKSPLKGFPSARSKRNSIELRKYMPSGKMRQWFIEKCPIIGDDEARYKSYWRRTSSAPHFEEISKVGPAPKGARNEVATYDEKTALVLAYNYVPPPEPVEPRTEEEIKKVSDLVDVISEYSFAILKMGAESEDHLRRHNRDLKRFLHKVVLLRSGQGELPDNKERPKIEIARAVPR